MSIDSATVSGGRIPGSRRAIMVLPDPGGPINRRLWPPAAAISSARFANCCPRTSQRSSWRVARRSRRSRASRRVGPIVLVPERCSNTSPRVSPPRTSTPSTAPASRAFAFGSRSLFTPRARHPAAIGSPPRIGLRCPSSPSSPTRQVPSTRSCGTTPIPIKTAMAIGRSKALPSLGTSAGARCTERSTARTVDRPKHLALAGRTRIPDR